MILDLGNHSANGWTDIINKVLSLPCHQDLMVNAVFVSHPIHSGFVESIGEPQGQIADYRKCLPSSQSIHVRSFDTFYKVHWDKKDPHSDPLGHLLEDAPHWAIVAGLCLLGLFFGLLSISNSDGK